MIITCSNCNEVLTDKDIDLKEKPVANDDDDKTIRAIYYITPCCKTINIVAYENSKCDRLKKDISIERRLNNPKRIKGLVNSLRIEMDRLKKTYGTK